MAGMIEISSDTEWVAANWLFDWVVRFLAERVHDEQTKSDLVEIVDAHLGWLGLDDRGPSIRAELEEIVRSQLVPGAEQLLPTDMPSRDAVVDRIRDLVSRVDTASTM